MSDSRHAQTSPYAACQSFSQTEGRCHIKEQERSCWSGLWGATVALEHAPKMGACLIRRMLQRRPSCLRSCRPSMSASGTTGWRTSMTLCAREGMHGQLKPCRPCQSRLHIISCLGLPPPSYRCPCIPDLSASPRSMLCQTVAHTSAYSQLALEAACPLAKKAGQSLVGGQVCGKTMAEPFAPRHPPPSSSALEASNELHASARQAVSRAAGCHPCRRRSPYER